MVVTGVAGWRVWFKGGSVYDSGVSWSSLPPTGCLLVMVYFDPRGRRYMSGSDWYFLQETDDGPIIGSLGFDSRLHLDDVWSRYPGAVILEGEWTTDKEMADVVAAAMASEAP